MKLIHLMIGNINVEGLKNIYKVEDDNIQLKNDKCMGYNYAIINDTNDSSGVYKIVNFPKSILYKLKDNETALEIMAKGYDVSSCDNCRYVIINNVEGIKHIVKPAETLANIAKKYNVSEKILIENNQLNTNKLYVGQILNL